MNDPPDDPPQAVIAAIYRAAQAPALWPQALAAVAAAVQADAATIHAETAQGERRVLEAWGDVDADPGGACIAIVVREGESPARPTLRLSLRRAAGRGDFDAGDASTLAAALPHLRRAIGLMGQAAASAATFRAAFDAFTTPTLICEADGQVVYANRAVDRLAGEGALCLMGGRLHLADPAAAEQLAKALAGGGGEFKLAAAGPPCLVIVAPLASGGGSRLADLAGPHRAAVYLIDGRLDQAQAAGRERLIRIYGLTPTEAAIAVDLIQGRSIRDIAAARGSTTETVRGQVKLVLHKTSSPRQADLFRLQALLQVRGQDGI